MSVSGYWTNLCISNVPGKKVPPGTTLLVQLRAPALKTLYVLSILFPGRCNLPHIGQSGRFVGGGGNAQKSQSVLLQGPHTLAVFAVSNVSSWEFIKRASSEFYFLLYSYIEFKNLLMSYTCFR